MKHYIVKYAPTKGVKIGKGPVIINYFKDLLVFDPADSKRESKMAIGEHSPIFTVLADVDEFVLRTCGVGGFKELNRNENYVAERLGFHDKPDNKERVAKSIRLERDGFL